MHCLLGHAERGSWSKESNPKFHISSDSILLIR
jgi:hypothetical protein